MNHLNYPIFRNFELVSVTSAPGLAGSLLIGLCYARALSYALQVPLIEVDHVSAHIFANFLNKAVEPQFPLIGLVISGGHTNIFLCKSVDEFELVGRTQDDAVGEAFDKVAKILGLGYPGGPIMEKRAKRASGRNQIRLPRTLLEKGSLDFSFSGIKTAVYYRVKKMKRVSRREIDRIADSFQESVFSVLLLKTLSACRKFDIKELVVGGGVSSNQTFRAMLKRACAGAGIRLHIPEPAIMTAAP